SPIAGALIDGVGAAWAITVDMAASAILVALLAMAGSAGSDSPPGMLLLTACFLLTSPLGFAGLRALLPPLVPAAARDRANALDTAINGLTDIAGPATAGLIVALAGPLSALAVIAVIYAVAAFSLARVRGVPGALPSLRPLLRQAGHGLRRVIGEPSLR